MPHATVLQKTAATVETSTSCSAICSNTPPHHWLLASGVNWRICSKELGNSGILTGPVDRVRSLAMFKFSPNPDEPLWGTNPQCGNCGSLSWTKSKLQLNCCNRKHQQQTKNTMIQSLKKVRILPLHATYTYARYATPGTLLPKKGTLRDAMARSTWSWRLTARLPVAA